MIKAERMSKVTILCPKTYMDKVINKLYELNVYHLVPHQKTEELDIGSPLERSERLAEILIKLRSVISHLEIQEEDKDYSKEFSLFTEKDFSELVNKSNKIYENVVKNLDLIKELDEEIVKTNAKIKILKLLRDLRIDSSYLTESEIIDKFFGYVNNTVQLEQKLNSTTKRFELLKTKQDGRDVIALFTEKKLRDEIQPLLAEVGYAEIDISNMEKTDGRLVKNLRELSDQVIELNKKKHRAQAQLENIKKENKKFLLLNEEFLSEESKKAEIPLKFATTKKSNLIKGWVPVKKLSKVKKELQTITNNKIYFEEEKPGHDEPVPVKLKHSKWIKPFEFFLRLYELPNYGEIDPTILMFITFPIFFGFMLGDVGYGIVTLILFVLLKRAVKSVDFKALLNIMIFASILTIMFGFVYGEYFGFEHVSYEKGKWLCQSTGICLPVHELHTGGHEETEELTPTAEIVNEAFFSEDIIIESTHEETPPDIIHEETEPEVSTEVHELPEVVIDGETTPDEVHEVLPVAELHEEPAEEHEAAAHVAVKIADFPRLINRAHGKMNVFGFEMLSVLVIGAIIGFFHLNFALLIGFINIWMQHGLKHAFFEKISWLIMETGVILLVLSYTGLAPIYPIVGYLVLALSIVFIYLGEGVQGLVELPAIFSNMLSYMRLGAVGLASVGLAVVVNENLAIPFFEKGGIFIIFAVLIMVVGHIVNIGLGILGPFLHSLRLHYVEFFSKFYKGGGIEYKPFGYKKA